MRRFTTRCVELLKSRPIKVSVDVARVLITVFLPQAERIAEVVERLISVTTELNPSEVPPADLSSAVTHVYGTLSEPERAQLLEALRLVNDPTLKPVYRRVSSLQKMGAEAEVIEGMVREQLKHSEALCTLYQRTSTLHAEVDHIREAIYNHQREQREARRERARFAERLDEQERYIRSLFDQLDVYAQQLTALSDPQTRAQLANLAWLKHQAFAAMRAGDLERVASLESLINTFGQRVRPEAPDDVSSDPRGARSTEEGGAEGSAERSNIEGSSVEGSDAEMNSALDTYQVRLESRPPPVILSHDDLEDDDLETRAYNTGLHRLASPDYHVIKHSRWFNASDEYLAWRGAPQQASGAGLSLDHDALCTLRVGGVERALIPDMDRLRLLSYESPHLITMRRITWYKVTINNYYLRGDSMNVAWIELDALHQSRALDMELLSKPITSREELCRRLVIIWQLFHALCSLSRVGIACSLIDPREIYINRDGEIIISGFMESYLSDVYPETRPYREPNWTSELDRARAAQLSLSVLSSFSGQLLSERGSAESSDERQHVSPNPLIPQSLRMFSTLGQTDRPISISEVAKMLSASMQYLSLPVNLRDLTQLEAPFNPRPPGSLSLDTPYSEARPAPLNVWLPPEILEISSPLSAEVDRHQVRGYELLRSLGRGGEGEVSIARVSRSRRFSSAQERLCALKICSDNGYTLGREIEIAERCAGPHLIRYYTSGTSVMRDHKVLEKRWFAMELLIARPLNLYQHELQTRSDVDEVTRIKRSITSQVIQGLQSLHREGVIHLDLKPQNILVSADLNVKLIDLGLAQDTRDPQFHTKWEEIKSHTKLFPFSIPYASLEHLDGFSQLGVPTLASDLWGLGVILDELWVGESLFSAQGLMGFYQELNTYDESSLSARHRAAQVPRDISDLIARCLRRSPQERVADATLLDPALYG